MAGNTTDLLSLPLVALEKSLSAMPPTEILKISRTSKHCTDLIKNIKFNVKLESYGSNVDVEWGSPLCSDTFKIESEGKIIKEEEWRNAVTEITRLFRTSLTVLSVQTDDFDGTWRWISQEQKGLKELDLRVENKRSSRRIIKMMLDNSELTKLKEFTFKINIPASFKYNDSFIFKNPPKKLWIENSSWFTVQHLMDSKVESCVLRNSKFADEDINMILKEWKNKDGCLRNLKKIEWWRTYRINYDVAFEGFQCQRGLVCLNSSTIKLICGEDFYFEFKRCMGRLFLFKESVNGSSDDSEDSD